MPRPRLATDAEILMACFRVIAGVGHARLTLAAVAGECGLTAPALSKRYGHKRALLLAAAADAAAGHALLFVTHRQRHRSPLRALLALGDALAILGTTPAQVAHSLDFLHADPADTDFAEQARIGARTFATGIQTLVRDAMAAGELARGDVAALARALQAALFGSARQWTLIGDGRLGAFVRKDLATVLRGLRPRDRP
ncbi:MAG: TetR family transcriptional regulator [Planctomycetes bacterium]|nr:TetR family transcriptional regulator [Planctomycetota bacterium]